MIQISFLDYISDENENVCSVPFIMNGTILDKKACLTLASAGSMRFRWNEQNVNRAVFFGNKKVVPLELIHSQEVITVSEQCDTKNKRADGIISKNAQLTPVITVADCMPIYLYDNKSGCFGVLHSGWKGTGIVGKAIEKAEFCYGAKPGNFSVILGPHIHSCCYTVDQERVSYFSTHFSPSCISEENHLSLIEANLVVLEHSGVLSENIQVSTDCTCCSMGDKNPFGSFRRQTSFLPSDIPLEERLLHFSPMAAFVS